ncbi:MAG: hypothetical protein ACT4P1_08475 [Sporichthyaceae bacterium]
MPRAVCRVRDTALVFLAPIALAILAGLGGCSDDGDGATVNDTGIERSSESASG